MRLDEAEVVSSGNVEECHVVILVNWVSQNNKRHKCCQPDYRLRVRFGAGFARTRFVRLVVGALSSSDSTLDSSCSSSSSPSADSDAGDWALLPFALVAFVLFPLLAFGLLVRVLFAVFGVGVASAGVSACCDRALPGRVLSRPTPGVNSALSSSIDIMAAGEEAAAECSRWKRFCHINSPKSSSGSSNSGMCIASSRSSGSGSSEKAYWFSRSSRASSAYSWFSFFHMPDIRVCGASSVAKPWERMSLWMLIMRKCLCRPGIYQLEAFGSSRGAGTCWLPLHHAFEELRFLLIGPRVAVQFILRLRRPGLLWGLGLRVPKWRRSRASLCLLTGRHRWMSRGGVGVERVMLDKSRMQEQSRRGASARVRVGLKPPEVWRHSPPPQLNSTPHLPRWRMEMRHTMSSPVLACGKSRSCSRRQTRTSPHSLRHCS
jgi:hypothetical protein